MNVVISLTSNASRNSDKHTGIKNHTFSNHNNNPSFTTNNLHDSNDIQSITLQDNIDHFTKRTKKKKKRKFFRFPWCFRKHSRKESFESVQENVTEVLPIVASQTQVTQVHCRLPTTSLQQLQFPIQGEKPLWFSNHDHWEDQNGISETRDGITGYSSPRTTSCFNFFGSSKYSSSGEEDGIIGYSRPGCFGFGGKNQSDSQEDYKFVSIDKKKRKKKKQDKKDTRRKSNIRLGEQRPNIIKNNKRVRFSLLTRLSNSSESSDDSSTWVEEVRSKSIKYKYSCPVKIVVSMADDNDTDARKVREDPGLVSNVTNTSNDVDDGLPRPEVKDDEVSRLPVNKKIQNFNSFFEKSKVMEGDALSPYKAYPPSSQCIKTNPLGTQSLSSKPALLPKPKVGKSEILQQSTPVIHPQDISIEVLEQHDQKVPLNREAPKKENKNWSKQDTTTNNRMLVQELKLRFEGTTKSVTPSSTDQSNNNVTLPNNHSSFSPQSSNSESSYSPPSSLPSSTTSSFRDPSNNAKSSTIMQLKSRISQEHGLQKNESFRSSSSSDQDNILLEEENEGQNKLTTSRDDQSPQDVSYDRNTAAVVVNGDQTEEDPALKEFLETCDKSVKKLYYIAREVCTSEKVFVNALNLLNVDFRKEVAEKHLSSDLTSVILRHMNELSSISCHLLSELEDALQKWPETRKLSHVLVKVGPFLKVYSTYMQDFDSINNDLDDVVRRYPSFAAALKEFESQPKCKMLTLKHYLLKPVQRIPQYRLLLEDYLKHMTQADNDFEDTVSALNIVSSVAQHANNAVKTGDSSMKLLTIQNSLIRPHEIIKPGRTFLKEGELLKVSRKELQPRIFVLCSDCLFYLSVVQAGIHHLHHEMSLTGMRVTLPKQEDYKNEFTIISAKRSLIVQARSDKDRKDWFSALSSAIEENSKRRRTFMGINNTDVARKNSMVDENNGSTSPCRLSLHDSKSVRNSSSSLTELQEDENHHRLSAIEGEGEFTLGEEYPVWIPDERVTMCQVCTTEFSLTFRRHHCRACGKVVCNECSANRVPLKYLGYKKSRVCDDCRDKLKSRMKEKREKRKSVVSMGELNVPTESDGDYDGISPAASPYNTVNSRDGYKRTSSRTDLDTQFSIMGDNRDFAEDDGEDNVDYDKMLTQFERIPVRQSNRRMKPISNILKVSVDKHVLGISLNSL
jgi:FYVE/RhoGEF/PH domain-containing protein 5/6